MTAFRDLHRSGLLILPNAWDGGSAALMRSLGAKAIATTSAGVAWALGWPDGDALPVERVAQATRDVVRAAQGLPVSVDFEGGYSDDPAEVAKWPSPDRGVATFPDAAAVEAKSVALGDLITRWIAATRQA